MLIGIAAKNAVLIVEFANHLRDRGNELTAAIVKGSVTRLRPALMTSLCNAFGALPLNGQWAQCDAEECSAESQIGAAADLASCNL